MIYRRDLLMTCLIYLVNKPAGIPIFANRQVGHRRMTIEAVLPFTLQPPDANVNEQLKFPQPAHRLQSQL